MAEIGFPATDIITFLPLGYENPFHSSIITDIIKSINCII